MKQLTNEVFAQVRGALEQADIYLEAGSQSHSINRLAIAALDAAQSVPEVNAMLVEALERIADPRNKHFAGDAQVVASAALTAAQQAQPAPLEVECTCAAKDMPFGRCCKAAQPVQVNAMLVEALQAAENLEHEALVALSEATYELKVGNTYTTATDTYKANNDLIHRLDKILNSQYRDRKRAALTAAQQAQPEPVTYTPPKIIDPDAPHPCFN